jgi:hypothetical protein
VKESAERVVRVGFTKSPKRVCDEFEQVAAGMARDGWSFVDAVMEDGLARAHLFFEREIGGRSA